MEVVHKNNKSSCIIFTDLKIDPTDAMEILIGHMLHDVTSQTTVISILSVKCNPFKTGDHYMYHLLYHTKTTFCPLSVFVFPVRYELDFYVIYNEFGV
jgi:hypothetical protein